VTEQLTEAIDSGHQSPTCKDSLPNPERSVRLADLQSLATDLRVVIGRLARRLRTERGSHSLTVSQISALVSLEQYGPVSPTSLAHIERVKPPSMTKIIASLIAGDLAKKTPHESDGRQSLIAITEKGQDILDIDRLNKDVWLAKAMSSLDNTEKADILKAITALEHLAKS